MNPETPTYSTTYSIFNAVWLANALRARFGEPLLNDLPAGVRNDPERCVLASALNFGCYVVGGHVLRALSPPHPIVAAFPPGKREIAEALAEEAGTQVVAAGPGAVVTFHGGHRPAVQVECGVPLPAEVGNIVGAFDGGKLPQRYNA